MGERYKIVLSGKNLYKEIEITPDMETLSVGTYIDSEVRLRKELFFGTVQLKFWITDGEWSVLCSDNLYFDVGDVRKLVSLKLEHGSAAKVCYQDSDNEVFTLEYSIDFDYEEKNYDRRIQVKDLGELVIGGTGDAMIHIENTYVKNDSFTLRKEDGCFTLYDNGCRYGIYVNGARVERKREIRDYDFISIVGISFFYKEGVLYTSKDPSITVRGAQETVLQQEATALCYPKFVRNTRIQYEVEAAEIQVQQPTSKPNVQKKSIVLSLIPTMVMLAMTIVLRGIIGGGGTFVIYSAVSMGMGAIMSVVTYIQDQKKYRKETEDREKSYTDYIAEKESLVRDNRNNELRVRRLIYESLENSIREVETFGKRLFEREPEDKDFLKVYLGTGTVLSENQIQFTRQEFVDTTDPLSMLPEKLSLRYEYMEDAPVVSDFNHSCGVGIVGPAAELRQLLRNITLDLAIRHFYKDVRLVYLLNEGYSEEFKWIRWLKNVSNEKLDVRNIVCDEESKNILLENLYAVLSEREAQLTERKECRFQEQYIVLVTDASMIGTYPVSKYIKSCADYGFTFVFLEEHEEKIPQGCTEMIRLDGSGKGEVLKACNGDRIVSFTYPSVSNRTAEEVALRLGGVYVDEVSLEGQLTKSVTMFELLGIISVEDLDLRYRWEEAQVYRTLAAPIGVKSGNEIVSLNISDKSDGHGPHGLVAGTTGSGKSEILQTYILSMATLYHPYDVGFVIIDFKGGGMANQFADLPHLIGTITNIDGREINRSLLSIKAELVRRQEMFSEAGVNHISDYIRLYKSGRVKSPMPHLIMIVDEFAELKSEYPDFMKELISAARIGRTLGVHLILATQKPAGVVDAQIWSNSKFKLCLKVQTKEDSNEVLKTPLAAEIVEPGRAYFQVGNNEIFDLMQSAYSGANIPEGNDARERKYAIYERNFWGRKKLVYTNKKDGKSSEAISQLEAIVDYVKTYCAAGGIERLPGICLPSLSTMIRTEELNYEAASVPGCSVPVGLYDDPEQQRQGYVELELSRDNIYIVGSAQMGKTVLLQTIAYGLIRKYTPEQMNLYMVDCGSLMLRNFEDSSHVGGVVLSSEEEKCRNLFKLLNTFIIERKKALSGRGVGNFASYLEAGYTDMPMVVVMIDNVAAFREYFPDQAEQINSLSREAQGVGISFVVTAASSNALNYRTQANFGRKIVLNCNDSSEYSNVFGHCKETPGENAGRGLFLCDRRVLELQIAIFGRSTREADRNRELKAYIEERNSASPHKAVRIPVVPEHLSLADEMSCRRERFQEEGIIPLGMEFDTVEYAVLDIVKSGSLALLGEAESRVMFMKAFLNILKKNIVFHNAEVFILDDRQRSLGEAEDYGFVRVYTNDISEGVACLSDFYDQLSERENADGMSMDMSTVILFINNAELLKQICADKGMGKELSGVLKRANDAKVFLLLGQVENLPVGFNSSEVLKTLKEERQGILFAPVSENKFYEVGGRVRADTSFDKTMGYRFDNGSYSKIKIFE